MGVQRVCVARDVSDETLAVEGHVLGPVRVRGLMWDFRDACRLGEETVRPGAPIRCSRPALTIHPTAVDAVPVDDFLELRDENLVVVGAVGGHGVRVPTFATYQGAVGMPPSPLGVL